MIALLPASVLVVAAPVSYDISLADGDGCLAVTVGEDAVRVEALATPRPLDELEFRIEGDLAGLGRLLVYGRVRRRLSRRVARVRGERRAVAALHRLIRDPLGLRELYASGVRLEAELALLLIASMIEREWTVGERFAVGHEPAGGGRRTYLLVRDGERFRDGPRSGQSPARSGARTTSSSPCWPA